MRYLQLLHTLGCPHLAGDGVFSEHERTDRAALRDVEERRVASLMGLEVGRGEGNRVGAAMAVDGEVRKSLATAVVGHTSNELAGQRPVASLARNVIHAVPGEKHIASEEPHAAGRPGHAGDDDAPWCSPSPGKRCAMSRAKCGLPIRKE